MLLTFSFAKAQCLVYSTSSKYSTGNLIGRFESNLIYSTTSKYSTGNLVGRIEDGLIYSTTSKYSTGNLIGRTDGGGMTCGAAAAYLLLF